MGIDGIGNKGPPAAPPPGGTRDATRPTETGRPFEVHRPAAPLETSAVAAPQGALEQLRAGKIDLNGYVDAKVHEATAHLGVLPPAKLEAIRSALRERMTSDPLLADLLRTATGAVGSAATSPQGDE